MPVTHPQTTIERQVFTQQSAGTPLTNSIVEASMGYAPIMNQPGIGAPWRAWRFVALVRTTLTQGTDTFQLGLRIGTASSAGITGTLVAQSTAVDVANNNCAQIEGTLYLRPDGTLVVRGLIGDPGTTGATTKSFGAVLSGFAPAAGARIALDVTGIWSVASVNDSAQLEQLDVYELTVAGV